MKNNLLCWLILLGLYSSRGWAQSIGTVAPESAQGDPIQELRESLAGLDAARIPTGVLLNRMMLMTDPHRFAGRGDTLTDWQGWEQQYWEFYNASLQTQKLPTLAAIQEASQARLLGEEVPLLMLSYRYEEFRPDAAANRLITIDSVNERVTDGPDFSRSPYVQGALFSVALARAYGQGKCRVYVGKEFWLGNQPVPASIWLDFGDGLGWREVMMGSTVEIDILPAASAKASGAVPPQLVRAYEPTNWNLAATSVQHRTTLASVPPDVALGLVASRAWPGFSPNGTYYAQQGNAKAIAWIKYATTNTSSPKRLRKPLVFVEGIDFEMARGGKSTGGTFVNYQVRQTGPIALSSFTGTPTAARGGYRNGSAGWNEMVDYNEEYKALEKMSDLRRALQEGSPATDGDYDLIYLDFSDGASLIQHNAMVLAELLEWINQPVNRTTDAEETIVIGASMGGQVARFGLAWMEQQGLCHNSKLYVSVDSPHRGANIPLGIQHMFDRLQNVWIGSSGAQGALAKLRREAAQQMLVFHFDYGATGLRNQWQNWQSAPGSYPALARKVAVANGSGQAVGPPGTWPGMQLLHTRDSFFSGASFVAGYNYAYALPGAQSRGHNNVIFRYLRPFALTNNWHYTYADWRWSPYDTAPGSQGRIAGDAHDESPSNLVADWNTNTFMPTISVLDVKEAGNLSSPDFSYNVQQRIPVSDRPSPAKYAFDAYFSAANVNEPHIQITNGQGSGQRNNDSYYTDNSSWIRNELRESAHHMPAVLTTDYNFGNSYRHLLPSVQINSGGRLFINNWTLPVSGGTPATQAAPSAGNFEVYTSSCATVVQVNNGGRMQLGVGSVYSATLQISANSLLDLRAGSQLNVGHGSILHLVAGATLVVRNGASLSVSSQGQLIVDTGAYICIENPANIVVDAGATYNVSLSAIYSANPALNLGSLACNQPSIPPLQVAISNLSYTNPSGYCTAPSGANNRAEWTATATGGNGLYAYNWFFDATGTGNSYVQQPNSNYPTFGTCLNGYSYYVRAKVVVTSGSQQATADYYAQPQRRTALYPNPADGQVEIATEEALGVGTLDTQNQLPPSTARSTAGPAPLSTAVQVKVYNVQGYQVFASGIVATPSVRLNTQAWPAGLYEVVVQNGKTITRHQLSVQH